MSDNGRIKKKCCPSKKLVFHVFDVLCLTVLLIFQGTVMNYYVIRHYNASQAPLFLFLADFICLAVFMGALARSYSYLRKVSAEDSTVVLRRDRHKISPFGLLPLSYLSWLFYVSILVAKIFIIFDRAPLLRSLRRDDLLGPQFLKVTIALSGIIFLLLLEGHNWVKRDTPRYQYISSICSKTGIELFDSISILSILFDEFPGDGDVPLPESTQDFILIISAFNFFLPALKLYQLSFPDEVLSNDKRKLLVSVTYYMLHLGLVDVPYLSIRLYLWLVYKEEASMFIMKNVLSIILTLRGMYPDVVAVVSHRCCPGDDKSSRRSLENDKFEEIALSENHVGERI